MMKNLGEKVRKKDLRKMIKEADLNNDGKISFSGKCIKLWPFPYQWIQNGHNHNNNSAAF